MSYTGASSSQETPFPSFFEDVELLDGSVIPGEVLRRLEAEALAADAERGPEPIADDMFSCGDIVVLENLGVARELNGQQG